MLSNDASEHQILKIFLGGGGMPPDPPTWAANAALAAFGGASAPSHSKTTSFAYAYASSPM